MRSSRLTPIPPTFAEFSRLSPREKAEWLRTDTGLIQSFIYSQQCDRPFVDQLCTTAERLRTAPPEGAVRRHARTLLTTRSAALYFSQPSTRTFVSFSLAAQALGMSVEEIRDPDLSSRIKGETEIDTLLTLAELADAIVMRQSDPVLIDRFAYELARRGYPTRVINAGNGSDQHPTQALLELYTLVSRLDLARTDRIVNVAIVGDLRRARTARSLSYLLALYPNVRHVFIAPPELQMGEDLTRYLDDRSVSWMRSDDLDAHLGDLDAVYMMRMQDEYGETSQELREQYERYRLTPQRAARLKPGACILHPLPRRDELPIEIDDDPRACYWEAVNRGKFIRMALLLAMFGAALPA